MTMMRVQKSAIFWLTTTPAAAGIDSCFASHEISSLKYTCNRCKIQGSAILGCGEGAGTFSHYLGEMV